MRGAGRPRRRDAERLPRQPQVGKASDRTQQDQKSEKKQQDKGGDARTANRALRLLLASLLVLVVGFMVLVRFAYVAPTTGRPMQLDALYTVAAENRLKSVRLLDQDAVIVGTTCLAPPHSTVTAPPDPQTPTATDPPRPRPERCYDSLTESFHTVYPSSQVAIPQMVDVIRNASGASIVVDRQTPKAVARLVVMFVFPLLMLANLFGLIFLARSGSESGLGQIAGFGRMRRSGRKSEAAVNPVTFASVAGADEAVAELREVIDYLTDPERFQLYGAAPPKGVLLFGPPGCGKTLLARATAGESGVQFFSTSGTEFVESLVGVGAARVRDLFRQVREAAPAILFIDEIDAVGRRRSGEGTSGGEREQTLNQLLVELDGFEVTSGIVLMGATNRPDILDPALLRPGRFDRHITMEAPDVHGRFQILELHARGRPLRSDVDFNVLARRTAGFTGADLANVINEAALLAIRESPGTSISPSHLSEAVLRVLHGPQRRGRLLSTEERRRVAFHECGHTIVAAALGVGDEAQRVSIVARGRGLAQSMANEGDRAMFTASELQARVATAVSGVACEKLMLGEPSTSAQEDIAKATSLAREMVGLYGMSSQLGLVRLLHRPDSYLDGDEASLDLVSGPTMADFDAEVRRLISAAEAQATAVLRLHLGVLEEMAEALQREETLEGPALEHFLGRVRGKAPATPNGKKPDAAPSKPAPRGRGRARP